MKRHTGVLTVVLTVGAIVVPVTVTLTADRAERKERVERSRDAGRYSDRDRIKTSKGEEDKLEQALKTGEEKEFYRRELEKTGGG
jgi:hypothetical protein